MSEVQRRDAAGERDCQRCLFVRSHGIPECDGCELLRLTAEVPILRSRVKELERDTEVAETSAKLLDAEVQRLSAIIEELSSEVVYGIDDETT